MPAAVPQCAVADDFDEVPQLGGARVLGEGAGHPVQEREEHAVGVAGLGHPVRDQEQGLAGDQRHPQHEGPVEGQIGEAQRESVARRQGPYAVGRDHEGWLVAEVDDLDGVPAVVGEPHQDGGGETLVVVAADRRVVADVPEHPHLQAVGDRTQDGFVVRGLTERAEQRGRRLHRPQPLALDVAEEQPGAAGARLDVEEVPADPGLAVGGEVDGRVVEIPQPGGMGRSTVRRVVSATSIMCSMRRSPRTRTAQARTARTPPAPTRMKSGSPVWFWCCQDVSTST